MNLSVYNTNNITKCANSLYNMIATTNETLSSIQTNISSSIQTGSLTGYFVDFDETELSSRRATITLNGCSLFISGETYVFNISSINSPPIDLSIANLPRLVIDITPLIGDDTINLGSVSVTTTAGNGGAGLVVCILMPINSFTLNGNPRNTILIKPLASYFAEIDESFLMYPFQIISIQE